MFVATSCNYFLMTNYQFVNAQNLYPQDLYLATPSFPIPTRKLGLVTLAKIPICATSAVLICFEESCSCITFLTRKGSRLAPRPFENGNKASRVLVKTLNFRNLEHAFTLARLLLLPHRILL